MTERRVHVTRTRTVQILGAYSAETHTAHDEATLAPEEDASAWRAKARKQLDAELDAWEADMRKMARDRLQAEAQAAAAAKAPSPAPPAAAPAPPAAAAPLPSDLRADLRAAALELQQLTGQPVNTPPPKTEADARKLLKDLRAAVFDTKKAKGLPTA